MKQFWSESYNPSSLAVWHSYTVSAVIQRYLQDKSSEIM